MEEDLLNLIEEDSKSANREYIHYDYIKRFVKMCFRKIEIQDFFIAMVIKEACTMPSEIEDFTVADMNKIYDDIYKAYLNDTKSTLINPKWVYKKPKAKVERKKRRKI